MALATLPKQPKHHNKRVGKHHKHTKLYHKAYWPYLPLIAIAAVGIMASGVTQNISRVLGASSDISPAALLMDTNAQRQKFAEPVLGLNSQLNAAAQAKANDMIAENYWSHATPDGKQPWYFISQSGYSYILAGENLAYGFANADNIVNAWMNSSEHRANILNSGYRDVGFGVASSPDFDHTGPETIVVAMYGSPANADAVPNAQFQAPTGAPNNQVLGASTLPASTRVAWVQLMTKGDAPWSLLVVIMAGGTLALLLALRHARLWHKAIGRSERFVIRHFWLDIVVVTLGTIAYILSRSAGFIG